MNIYENKKLASMLFFIKPFSRVLGIFFINLENELNQSKIKARKEDFLSICILMSLIYGLTIFIVLSVIFNYITFSFLENLNLIIIISVIIFIFSLFSFINYPKLLMIKKMKSVDNSLLFALRHILIKIRSGIPFFDAMVSIAYNDYGEVSIQFKRIIKDIQSGIPEIEALEKSSFLTPSYFFRKFVWQVTNSLRAGTDIEKSLKVIVNNLQEDRYIKIKEFSNKLSPIALMYIVFTVIFPAIALTIFSITSFFFEIQAQSTVFFIVPIVLGVFNLIFMSIMNSILPQLGEGY